MKTSENLQTIRSEKYYIPMEVTADTIVDFNINPADVVWAKIGSRRVRVVMIPTDADTYYEYMRPLWREDKRLQRQESVVSLDELYENTEYEIYDDYDIEAYFVKKAMTDELHRLIDDLDEIDRTIMMMYISNHTEEEIGQVIGMSQRGVNKRKHKVFLKLKSGLKDFE